MAGGGRGRTRSEALSRADLQILWLRRLPQSGAGAGGRAGSGYTGAARGLGRGRPWGAVWSRDPLPSGGRAVASARARASFESVLRSGAACGAGPETSSRSSCSQVPPQPLVGPRPLRPPPSPASPFRRKAPLSAAGRVESAPRPGRFRQWGWTAIFALGPPRRLGPPHPTTSAPELAGPGRASRGARWGSEFANFRGAGEAASARGGPLRR